MFNKKIIFCALIIMPFCVGASSGRKRTSSGLARAAQPVQPQALPTAGYDGGVIFRSGHRPRKHFFTQSQFEDFARFYAESHPAGARIDEEWRAVRACVDEEDEGVKRGKPGFSLRRDVLKYSKTELRKQKQKNKDLWTENQFEFIALQLHLDSATSEEDKASLRLEINGIVEQIKHAAVRQMFFSAAVAFFEKRERDKMKTRPKKGRFTGAGGSGPTQVS